MTDKRYRIELEVLTPLHIGTGSENDWVRGADYVQKDGKVYVIDIKKAVEKGIDVSNLFVSNDQRSRKGIEEIDSKRLESIAKYIFVSPQSTRNDIKSCIYNLEGNFSNNYNKVFDSVNYEIKNSINLAKKIDISDIIGNLNNFNSEFRNITFVLKN